jgi:hypothetical protein
MSDAADSWTKEARLGGDKRYSARDYDPLNEPCGMNADGHPINLPRMCKDVADVGGEMVAMTALVTAAANQQGNYIRITDGEGNAIVVTRMGATTVTVPGNYVSVAIANRAVRLFGSAYAYGYVASSSYSAGSGLTSIVIKGCEVPADLSALWFGQDPKNAPDASSMTAATTDAAGTGGAVPAPAAGEQNSMLCGDAKYHDPIPEIQVWS